MQIDTPSLPTHITRFTDVVARAEHRAETIDIDVWLDDHHPDMAYTEFLTAAVIDIAIIPVEREAVDMPLVDVDDET